MRDVQELTGLATTQRYTKVSPEHLRRAYLHLVAGEPNRCVLIDARESEAAVAVRIWDTVVKRLDPATAPVTLEDVAS